MSETKGLRPSLVLATLLTATPAWAASPADAEHAGPSTRDFLADESRVGGLAGTLIGGALTAHPAGTVVGAVVGYMVGKKSDFTPEEEVAADPQAAGEQHAPATSAPPVNPLAECFGDRSRSQARASVVEGSSKGEGSAAGGAELVSLVEFQAIGSAQVPAAGSTRLASAAPLHADNRRRALSPCYYYSSW